MSHIRVENRGFTCLKCGAEFEAEMLFNVKVQVFVAHIRTIRCPKCWAGGDEIAFKFASDDTAMQEQVMGESGETSGSQE